MTIHAYGKKIELRPGAICFTGSGDFRFISRFNNCLYTVREITYNENGEEIRQKPFEGFSRWTAGEMVSEIWYHHGEKITAKKSY